MAGLSRFHFLALAAGALSGLMSISLASGGFTGLALQFFAPWPLYLAGLALGSPAAVIAGLSGVLATFLVGDSQFALSYLATNAVPVVVLCHLALLNRTGLGSTAADSQTVGQKVGQTAGQTEWYPLGRLILAPIILAAGYMVAALLFTGGGLGADITAAVKALVGQISAQGQNGQAQIGLMVDDQMIASIARLVPAAVAFMWLLGHVVNGALAQSMLTRAGKAVRTEADIGSLRLPFWLAPLLLGAIALAYWGGPAGLLATGLAGILAAAYFLQGLGVIHALLRKLRERRFVFIALYTTLVLIGWLALFILALGLLDQMFDFRAKANKRGGEKEGK